MSIGIDKERPSKSRAMEPHDLLVEKMHHFTQDNPKATWDMHKQFFAAQNNAIHQRGMNTVGVANVVNASKGAWKRATIDTAPEKEELHMGHYDNDMFKGIGAYNPGRLPTHEEIMQMMAGINTPRDARYMM